MTFVVDAWAANKSADAQKSASKKSIAEQQRQFDLTRSDQMPWMQAGTGALGQMQALNNGDFSKFYQSPDYQFALDQGIKSLDRSAAARGRLYSGGYGQDLTNYAQGLATQNYGNYYGRLADMAGIGQSSAQNLAAYGQNKANAISTQYGNIGQARASAYQGYGQAFNKAANQFGTFFGGG
jgi:hypothetical protein